MARDLSSLLLVVCCLTDVTLLVAWLFVVCRLLLVACCLLLVVWLFVVCCLLLVACCLLLAACC